ncbi:carotenoid biosynthesis protein [Alicyclobacillus acidiphilus]|uniref:carotenoid biosynthesis protein n=1 Tax=Alicyclobacillus acidiphilus TaxID=182455 RepID=UPI000831E3DC|nr:carotenoid biosynthesis protein [Alicyclobacillus acidiphilus]
MNTKEQPGGRSGVGLWILTWMMTVIIIGESIAGAFGKGVPALMFLGIPFAFWHGGRRYGAKGIILFFVITEIISNCSENLSIMTGFPFGHYYYTQNGTPFLFHVPITIGIAYFCYGYLAWCLASTILRNGDERTNTLSGMIIQPITASFIMVMWDLVFDPISSTVEHQWIWENGGGYNGVPLTNYLGWFLTVWVFFQVFAVILRVRPQVIRPQSTTGFWVMPIMIYGATAVSYLVSYLLLDDHRTITDAVGHTWTVPGIYESSTIIMLFTMLFATYLAAITLLNSRSELQRAAGSTAKD